MCVKYGSETNVGTSGLSRFLLWQHQMANALSVFVLKLEV